MSKLVIVESSAKAKTIKKYLGEGYDVVASMGHIIDLPKSKLGVDVDNDFAPDYVTIEGKDELVKNLKKQAKKSDGIFLATDPDREGEAISWHLAKVFGMKLSEKNRVTFNEITKSGVKHGMDNPRQIDVALVDAQQTRRILDRIVGYKLSPFLWKKVRRGLSAGRVQSVAVRLISDREDEIKVFVPVEYWSIDAKLLAPTDRREFTAKFYGKDGKQLEMHTKEDADAILKELEGAEYEVVGVKKGLRKKAPAPPFITSTLQQEASRKLGFQARRTMKAAQELYEGIDVEGQGAVGLITYMRTDSLRISDEAALAAENYIDEIYGKAYRTPKRRVFKSKSGAQDAHEAIRPTMPEMTPASLKKSLSSDQYKLYKLIWERFIASQMANAQLETVSVEIIANGYSFKASGYSVKFDGYTVLYEEGKDDEEENSTRLPELEQGDMLKLLSIDGGQHFTQPPARFTEASLIKTLEENGIGRPSTYAPIISTILSRGYVEREGKSLKPTILGTVTTQLMCERFPNIVDVEFTANMEKTLDDVAEGNSNWVGTLKDFYSPFMSTLEKAEEEMKGVRIKIPDEETDEICQVCGKKMVIKSGRFGKFLACSGFPECTYTQKIKKETAGNCPICGAKMMSMKSKNGKEFYGCSRYPECEFMSWDVPLAEECPDCGATLFRKKGRGGKTYCAKEGCGYVKGMEDAE
ncbi:MAG: type I DNA topoisomerase [Oscillospiraceae bacterium]|nr:type I DNA topoisomerase [Oscillospiraceae bacterium]